MMMIFWFVLFWRSRVRVRVISVRCDSPDGRKLLWVGKVSELSLHSRQHPVSSNSCQCFQWLRSAKLARPTLAGRQLKANQKGWTAHWFFKKFELQGLNCAWRGNMVTGSFTELDWNKAALSSSRLSFLWHIRLYVTNGSRRLDCLWIGLRLVYWGHMKAKNRWGFFEPWRVVTVSHDEKLRGHWPFSLPAADHGQPGGE